MIYRLSRNIEFSLKSSRIFRLYPPFTKLGSDFFVPVHHEWGGGGKEYIYQNYMSLRLNNPLPLSLSSSGGRSMIMIYYQLHGKGGGE